MEPVSISLSVIAFATAVKDIVELGQKIHDSFAKASKNYQKAQRVAKNITEMVADIETFSEDHKEELKNMQDFRLAVLGLLAKFRAFESSVIPLLPQAGGSKRERIIRAWDAWRRNNKTEEDILDLQSDVVDIMRRYMMKSAMRTERVVEKIHQETSQGLAGISEGLEVLKAVREDVSVIRVTTAANPTVYGSYESSASGSNEFDRQIIMFAQSTSSASAPMLRTPNVITEELMTAAYIKLQINHIVGALDKISNLPVTIPNDVNNFDMYESVYYSMKTTDLRHSVIRQVLDIRDRLNAWSLQTTSICDGASALNNLSFGLEALQMVPESLQLSEWATNFIRTATLVSSGDGHPDLCAVLSLYLCTQSSRYYICGDKTRSLQVIEEAYTIALDLRNRFNKEARFQMLYSHILLHYSPHVDTQRQIEMVTEALQVLGDMLNIQKLTWSPTPDSPKEILQSSSSFLDHLFSSPLPVFAISSYALALNRLGSCLFVTSRHESAVDLRLLAIAVRRRVVIVHGDEYKVALAQDLSSLVQNRTARDHIPAEVLLSLTEECIQLFRALTEYNPLHYVRSLVEALWAKAVTLEGLGRDTEAIATLEEVISLAGQLIDDSTVRVLVLDQLGDCFRRLERHDDAVRTNRMAISAGGPGSEMQALRYTLLSKDLGALQRYNESTEAVRKSVTLRQHMTMRDPGPQVAALVFTFSELAYCSAASGDYSEAQIAWRESLSRLDNFLLANQDASSIADDNYFSALRTHISISYLLEDTEQSLKVGFIAAQYLRRLVEMCSPQDLRITEMLLWAEFSHAYNLLRFEHLQDAQQYIEDWVDRWRDQLEAATSSNIIWWHAEMIALTSNILDAQGRTEEALLVNQRVHNIARPSAGIHHPCFVETIKSMFCRAQLQTNLGNDEEALKVAEEALQLARGDHPGRAPMVRSLHGVASIALSCQKYGRALEIASEGWKICNSSNWQEKSGGEFVISCCPSLLALLSSAEANLDRCSTAVAYAKQAVEVSLGIRNVRMLVSTTTQEHSYMETRGNLAEILLATGDQVQARQICEERRAYFSKRVDARMGEYRDLVPILRMLGILCCSDGRHDEGNDAARELLQIMKTLRSAFPSLREQVKIRLRRQAQVPILKVLDDMCQKLDCEHQTDIASLFAA